MKQFTLFKSDKENYQYIVDVFKMLVGNFVKVEELSEGLIIYHQEYSYDEIKSTIQSLEADLNTNICVYQSYLALENGLKLELKLIEPLFYKLEFGCYNLKELLLNSNVTTSSELLHFIIDGTGVDERIIEMMALADLNVSKAANLLYLHRNSLNYKIDRLLENKGFDLRRFVDLYCLFRLL